MLSACPPAFPGASQMALVVKNPRASAGNIGDTGSIPRWGRSLGGGHGNPPQYSCLENPVTEEPGRLQSIDFHILGGSDSENCFLGADGSLSVSSEIHVTLVAFASSFIPRDGLLRICDGFCKSRQ